ncbi:MAG: hypothetical protein JNM69_20690 [Archangium sp.]|nr:hypothetical protein [Archangium sp.]
MLGSDRLFWHHSNGTALIDTATGAVTELAVKPVKYPSVVVGSADGARVLVCDAAGWAQVVTFGASKPQTKRLRVSAKLPLSGGGFGTESVVLRGSYPDYALTLHDPMTLAKTGTVKAKELTSVSPTGAVFSSGAHGTSLLVEPSKKPIAIKTKHELAPLRWTFDGSVLLAADQETGDLLLIDGVSGAVKGQLKRSVVADEGSNDQLLPLDAKHVVLLSPENVKHDLQTVRIVVFAVGGKKTASLEVTFNASKKQSGLAELVAVAPNLIVLNAETAIDVRS